MQRHLSRCIQMEQSTAVNRNTTLRINSATDNARSKEGNDLPLCSLTATASRGTIVDWASAAPRGLIAQAASSDNVLEHQPQIARSDSEASSPVEGRNSCA